MSMLTFGPPQYVDGALPSAPPRSLLTIPGVLQQAADNRWTNGAALWGYPDGVPDTWDPCTTGTFRPKSDISTFEIPDFAAFVAYLPVTCSSFTVASDPDGFAQRAEVTLDATISFAVEQALARGIPMSTNPFLADANVSVLAAGAAKPPLEALAWLEDAIGETGRGGMIHATPAVTTSWFATFPLFEPDLTSTLYTPNGTPVSSGGGYKGSTPNGQAAASSGQEWVYATGPVQVWLADEATLDIEDVLDRTLNDVTFRAERYALVTWDTSLQAAVLVDWGA